MVILQNLIKLKKLGASGIKQSLEDEGATFDDIRYMKRLSKKEIEDYIKSNEWKNVAGSYRIQGHAESFIKLINGSYSNIVGLPLYETRNILKSVGVI